MVDGTWNEGVCGTEMRSNYLRRGQNTAVSLEISAHCSIRLAAATCNEKHSVSRRCVGPRGMDSLLT